MKRKLYKVMLVTLSVSMISFIYFFFLDGKTEKVYSGKSDIEMQSETIDFDQYDSLMIIAHPDDETIWGGAHLLNDNDKYVVVCITSKNNKTRNEEFYNVMKQSESKGIMLSYPDKTNGKRDNWESSREAIQRDIDFIVTKKSWKQIVTHNPNGEYGHQHHQMSSQMVTKAVKQSGKLEELMYFGKYIKKKKLAEYKGKAELNNPLTNENLQSKKQLIMFYSSQKKVMDHLQHMFPYENWISYHTWYNN